MHIFRDWFRTVGLYNSYRTHNQHTHKHKRTHAYASMYVEIQLHIIWVRFVLRSIFLRNEKEIYNWRTDNGRIV